MTAVQDGAFSQRITRYMPRCFECGWDGPAMMRDEADAAVLGHNMQHHPDLIPAEAEVKPSSVVRRLTGAWRRRAADLASPERRGLPNDLDRDAGEANGLEAAAMELEVETAR